MEGLMLMDGIYRRRQHRDDLRFQNAVRADMGMPPLEIPAELAALPEADEPQLKKKRYDRPRPIVEVATASDDFWPPEPIRWRAVIREVAQKHRLPVPYLLSTRRDHQVVVARHEAFFRLRTELAMSLPAIGRRFGMDHTSILHGVRKHAEREREKQGSASVSPTINISHTHA